MPTRLDEGPPPSTYAAQIVDNLENARERTQLSGSRTQLAQLFRAVLALDTNDLTDDETFETNLAINHRLIWTIVRGCLCFQGTANPFDSHAEVTDLARDGLAVIMVTVRRYPEVVFTSLGKDTTYAAPEGPLFVWVVPRLLTLLRHENESTIFHGARDLLYKMLEIKSASRMAKFRRQPVLTYLRNCVDGILSHDGAMLLLTLKRYFEFFSAARCVTIDRYSLQLTIDPISDYYQRSLWRRIAKSHLSCRG